MGDQVDQAENGNGPPIKNQLEDLSKEDLIQQLKKQRMLLQKMKLKCDEFSKKNNLLENDLAKERECFVSTTVDDSSQEKIKKLERQCGILQETIASVQDENLLKNRKNKELLEQLECMQMKEGTLNSAMMCIQEEINKLSLENKALKSDNETLRSDQDKASALTSTNAQLVQLLQEAEQEHEKCSMEQTSLKDRLRQEIIEREKVTNTLEQEHQKFLLLQQNNELIIMENGTLKTELEGKAKAMHNLIEETQTLVQSIQSLEEVKAELECKLADSGDHITFLSQTIKSLEDTKIELELKVEDSKNNIRSFEKISQEKEAEKEKFVVELQHMEELRQTKDQLQSELDNMSLHNAEVQIKVAEKLLEDKTECERLQQVLDQIDRNRNELELQNKQLTAERNEFEKNMYDKIEALNILNEKCQLLESRIHTFEKKEADLQKKVEDSAERVISLEKLLDEKELEKQKLVAELEKMRTFCSERDQMQQTLEEEREQSSQNANTEALEAASSEINKFKQHNELLESDLEFTKVDCDRPMFEENREYYDSPNFSTSETEMSVSEVDRLKKCIELLEAELSNAKEERDRLLFQEEKEEADSEDLQNQLQKVEAELEDLRTKLESAEFESEELRANLEDAQQELVKLRNVRQLEEMEISGFAKANDASLLQSIEAASSPVLLQEANVRELSSVEDISEETNTAVSHERMLEENRQRLEYLESEKMLLEAKLTSIHEQERNLRLIVKEMLVCLSESESDFSFTDEDHVIVWLQCLKGQLCILTEKNANLTTELQEKDSEIVKLKTELADTVHMLAEQNETVLVMKSSMQTLQEDVKKATEEKDYLDEKLNKMLHMRTESDEQLNESKATMQQLKSDLLDKEKRVEECTVETEEHLKNLKLLGNENGALKEEVDHLKSQLVESVDRQQELQTLVQTVQEAVDKGIEEKRCLEEELNKMKNLNIENLTQLNESNAEVQQLKACLLKKDEQEVQCMTDVEEKSKIIALLGDENISLKEDLQSLNSQLKESIERQQEFQIKVSECESTLELLQSTLHEKETKFAQLLQDHEDKTTQLHTLRTECESLRFAECSLKEQLLEIEVLHSKLIEAEGNSEELRKEVKLLHEQALQHEEQKAQKIEQFNKDTETEQAEKNDASMQTEDYQTVEIEHIEQTFDIERQEYENRLRMKEDAERNLLDNSERLKAEVITLQESIERLHGDVHTSKQDFSKLEVALEESVERGQKYKAVAMKTKKELLDAKQQVSDLEQSLQQVESDKDMATKQLETCKEVLEEVEDRCSSLQNDLDKALYDMATVRSQLADLQADKDNLQSELSRAAVERKQLEHIKDDLDSQVCLLTEGKKKTESLNDELSGEIHQLKEHSTMLEAQLSKEKEAHQSKSIQLDKLQQQMKQRNMMNLEIEDYERLVSELNQQVTGLTSQKDKLEDEVQRQQEMAVGLRTQLEQAEAQRQQAEDRGNKLKALLVKAKKDLVEGKRKEAEHQSAQTKSHVELELCKQESERIKVEYAEILGQNQKAHESMRLLKESQQRIVRSLESQVASLQEDISSLRREYDACQADYEGYKVRVHSVLKQQKSKVSTPSGVYKTTQDVESLEKTIEHLKVKLQEVSEQLMASLSENQILQDEHDRLLQRHNKLLQEIDSKEAEWKIKLTSLVTEGNAQEDEREETIKQLQRQNAAVTATFKDQLRTLKTEHERLVENLRLQLAVAEAEICRLQRDQQKMSPTRDDDLFDVTITERQEGEGSENTEPVSSTPNKLHDDYTQSSTTVSLEQLLSTDDKASIASTTHDLEGVDAQLGIAAKRIDHLSELLNESEASNIRLTEQTRVLKEEIRRLERNQQREQHVSNLEYLKNVVIKFLTLQAGDERERLIPVLTMLLQLSPQERTELGVIAKGASAEGGDGSSSGWETYLPRWSGLV